MSADATGWVFRHSPFNGITFAVHLAMADSVNDLHANEFWMSQERLATKARTTRKTARAALEALIAEKFLAELPGKSTDHGGSPVRRFRFLFPDHPVVYETRWAPPSPVGTDDPLDPVPVGNPSHPSGYSGSSQWVPTTHKPKEPKESTQVKASEVSDAALLCQEFADQIASRGNKRPAVTKAWEDEMDRLLRLDHRELDHVRRVLKWLNAGADPPALFWRPNVRSPAKLREKWDQMAEQYKIYREKAANDRSGPSGGIVVDRAVSDRSWKLKLVEGEGT